MEFIHMHMFTNKSSKHIVAALARYCGIYTVSTNQECIIPL